MSFDVHVLPSAERDVAQARDWYEDKAELGLAFVEEFRSLLHRLRQLPNRFPEVCSGLRRVLFVRFPYVLYFRVADQRVDVVAILHSRSGPTRVARRAR